MKTYALIYVLSIATFTYSFKINPKADCAIAVNGDLGEPQPLILRPGAPAGEEWAYPSSGDVISVPEGTNLLLACPGSTLLVGPTDLSIDSIEATCVGGLTFAVGAAGETSFTSITCESYPMHLARYTGASCENDGREIEIGFQVGTLFLKTITICFDPVNQVTLWSRFVSTIAIGGYQSGFDRPYGFMEGDFYNVGGNISDLFPIVTQRVTINQLVGLPDDSTKYIGSGDFYLARGHLTAKADFVFGNQHNSTFWYVNVAPQWQTFNGRNWAQLELDVRTFQAERPNDILVTTGTYGVTTLPHETTGEEVPLYLYVNGEERGIPVPEIYWKVAYDPVLKAAIAFVGSNNPYRDAITRYCTNICDQISWLTWEPEDVTAGLSYCCDVRELRDVITHIPDMDVTSILT